MNLIMRIKRGWAKYFTPEAYARTVYAEQVDMEANRILASIDAPNFYNVTLRLTDNQFLTTMRVIEESRLKGWTPERTAQPIVFNCFSEINDAESNAAAERLLHKILAAGGKEERLRS